MNSINYSEIVVIYLLHALLLAVSVAGKAPERSLANLEHTYIWHCSYSIIAKFIKRV